MTNDELAQYYANLLIIQYIGKPRAYATVKLAAEAIIVSQLPDSIQNSYDIDTAVGVQLDILGKYVGAFRNAQTMTSQVQLTDDELRLLIKIKILSNNSGSSLKNIQDLIQTYLPGSLRVFDYQNMSMSYFMNSNFFSLDLAEVVSRGGYLPKPMGVQVSSILYTPTTSNWFGMRTYTAPAFDVSGLNTYGTYHTDRHFVTYADAI